jgi:Tfp pilus assembly PilM family ATPase
MLGLSISEDAVHIVAITRRGSTDTLAALAEWQHSLSVTPDVLGSRIEAFLRANEVSAKEIAVAIDSSKVFLHFLPVIATAGERDIQTQVSWELTKFFPGTEAEGFINDTHLMSLPGTLPSREVLSVSVRREEVRNIQAVLTALHLKVRCVDVDHFSAEIAYRRNYPERADDPVALVGLKRSRLDVSILRNNELGWYSYYIPKSEADGLEHIASLVDTYPGLQGIVLYGPTLKHQLLAEITEASALPVEQLNPFLQLEKGKSLLLADHFLAAPYRFSSAVGVALREG